VVKSLLSRDIQLEFTKSMLALGVKKFKLGDLEVEFHEKAFNPKIETEPLVAPATEALMEAAEKRAQAKKLQKDAKSAKIGGRIVDESVLFHSSKA